MDARPTGEEFSRNPTIDDLVELCRHMNSVGTRYLVIGGFAMIHYGYVRTTADIDLLVADDDENIRKIRDALSYLPDNAAAEIQPTDLRSYAVVRVGDEIVVDLMGKACEVTYESAKDHVETALIADARIPYVSLERLLETKQGLRAQDIQDRMYLEQLLKEKSKAPDKP